MLDLKVPRRIRPGVTPPFFFALFLASLMIHLPGPRPSFADTAIVPASKDNTLFSDPTGALSSGSGQHFFAGSNSAGNARRAVIAFDVAAHLPAGATIDSLALVLNVSSAPNETPQLIGLHRVLADWGEGASVSVGGGGAPSAVGDATWLHTFYPDRFWSNVGGDFVVTASATQTVGVSGSHAWAGPAMVIDVQSWLDNPATNFGWALVGTEATPSTVRRFDSREHDTLANRPFLFVIYTTGTTPTRQSTLGAVKALYHKSPNE